MFYWNNHLHAAQYERCCRRLDWRTLHNVLLQLIPSTRSFPSNLTVYCRLWPGQAKALHCWHPTVRNQSTKASRTFTISPAALQQLPPACTQLNIRMRRRAGSPTPRVTWQLLLPPRSHRSDHDSPDRVVNKQDELPSKLCASVVERSRIESPGPLGHSRTLGEVATGLGWSSSDDTVQRIHPDWCDDWEKPPLLVSIRSTTPNLLVCCIIFAQSGAPTSST